MLMELHHQWAQNEEAANNNFGRGERLDVRVDEDNAFDHGGVGLASHEDDRLVDPLNNGLEHHADDRLGDDGDNGVGNRGDDGLEDGVVMPNDEVLTVHHGGGDAF